MNRDRSQRAHNRLACPKSREDFRTLFHNILNFANRGLPRVDFLCEVSKLLVEFSGADAVELRLVERRRYFRCEATKDRSRPVCFEVTQLEQNNSDELPPVPPGGSDFERLCWNVMLGHFGPSSSGFTRNGSFWTGDTERPIELYAKADVGGPLQSIIIDGPHRSLILFPITAENANIGLVLLKSHEKDFFKADEVSFYESLGHNISVALTHRRAQVALRERVKELTCLYGISRLVEQPDIALPRLLQGIVDLLPPAWLYPEIAQGRITLNGNIYSTPDFDKGVHRQTADVIVGGQKRGAVEVAYIEDKPELDEGPFLKEERSLIDTVAREVALVIERRQAEEEKARLQEQLRHADRLATIGQLAAGVAHELNEPLGNILGFAQLAKKSPGLPEQAAVDIDKIVKASLYAREVIRKLMIFSRQVPSRKAHINLNKVVEEGLNLLQGRLVKSGVEVLLSLLPDLPEVTADAAQLNQVLVNLIVNAAQAMPNGGVLTIKTAANDDTVSLVVEDTGTGMTEDVKKQIFIPFFTTKDVSQGTGLGLAVVHGIVTAHGGTIRVDSEVGKGTKFTIRLPVAKEAASQ